MAAARSIKEALELAIKKIKPVVNDALLTDVADTIKIVEREHIYDDVYTRDPGRYTRRYDNGGLGDMDNMYEYLEGDGLLGVAQGTPFNPYINGVDDEDGISENTSRGMNGLDGLVNYGDGWKDIRYDVKPWGSTGFIEKTVGELKSTKEHVGSLRNGLIARGLDVK